MRRVFLSERQTALLALAKKSSSPNRATRQNQFIRTNHSRHAFLVSTPVGNSSPALRPPCLCALCVEFPFPASVFIVTLAQEGRFVAQGAASFAGLGFFLSFLARDLKLFEAAGFRRAAIRRTNSVRLTPLECALTQKYRGVGTRKGLLRSAADFSAALCILNVGAPAEDCIHGRNIVASGKFGSLQSRGEKHGEREKARRWTARVPQGSSSGSWSTRGCGHPGGKGGGTGRARARIPTPGRRGRSAADNRRSAYRRPHRLRFHGGRFQIAQPRIRVRRGGLEFPRAARIGGQLRRQQESRVHHLLSRRVFGGHGAWLRQD